MAPTWRNFSASSGKPSSSAVLANSSYMSVHSKFSPSAAAPRFWAVSPMPSSSRNHIFAWYCSLALVLRKISAICSKPSFFATDAK